MKNKQIEIKETALEKVLEIRREVRWPDKPISLVAVPGDKRAIHLGLFVDGIIKSVISLFINKEHAQFRKFATRTSFQGKGYGTTLLQYVFDYLESK